LAWTTPKTWSAGETLTAANFNAQIRDNLALVPHNIPKTADQSVTSSTALIDDTHLQFAIGASEAWNFRFVLAITGPGFLKAAFNAPAGATGWWDFVPHDSANAKGLRISATFVDGETQANTGDPVVYYIDGYVLNSATPGTFKLRWAQANSNGTATVLKKGSWLERQKN
jgi:hypothetical protein